MYTLHYKRVQEKCSLYELTLIGHSLFYLTPGIITHIKQPFVDRDNAVGIATMLRLDVGVRVPVGKKFFAFVQTGLQALLISCTVGTAYIGGLKRPGCGVNHPSHLPPRLQSRALPPLPLWAFMTSCKVSF